MGSGTGLVGPIACHGNSKTLPPSTSLGVVPWASTNSSEPPVARDTAQNPIQGVYRAEGLMARGQRQSQTVPVRRWRSWTVLALSSEAGNRGWTDDLPGTQTHMICDDK